jgi:hypothetical protein
VATLDDPKVEALMREAVARAKVGFDPRREHRLIIKSVSAKQRPRRPAVNDTAVGTRLKSGGKGLHPKAGAATTNRRSS